MGEGICPGSEGFDLLRMGRGNHSTTVPLINGLRPSSTNMHATTLSRAVLAGTALVSTVTALGAPSALVAYWDFNDSTNPKVAKDAIRSTPGAFQAATAFTADSGGFSGAAGDRAVDFGAAAGGTYVRVSDGSFMNLAGVTDTLTVTFWQKRHAQNDSSAFWANSTTAGGGRGAQAHAPWSNGRIYFDTAGCCNSDQRIDKAITDLDPAFAWNNWHHFAFVKNGLVKQIYVDGVLFHEDAEVDAAPLPTDFTSLHIGADGGGGGNSRAMMDDFAVFAAALDPAQILSLANKSKKPTEITATLADADNDGLPDAYETLEGLDPAVANGTADPDSDGLTNLQEYGKGTKPTVADTDGDGLKDGAETGTGTYASATDTGTNPLAGDSDGDGLSDGVENNSGTGGTVANPGTNPNDADTDDDGAFDGLEVHFGTSPFNAAAKPALVAGKRNLLAYFPFNNATAPEATVDVVHNYAGTLLNGAAYSGDASGFSGAAGDNAVDFGADSANRTIRVDDGTFMNLGAANDTITITFWQRLYQTAATSSFWAESPSSLDGARGFQVHNPWSDGTIYFDTTGAGAGRRINKNVVATPGFESFDWTAWHHFALVKNKGVKQIWIDGVLFHSGTGALPFAADFTRLWIGSNVGGAGNVQGALDDFAVFGSTLSSADIKVLAAKTFTPIDVHDQKDTDNDGITDIVKSLIGDPNADLDSDGSNNLAEINNGTDPANPDTDGDGLKDGAETKTGTYVSATDTGTDPLNGDSDGDGVSDSVENNSGTFVNAGNPGTNPNKADTDGDGLSDGIEVASICGSDPTKADSVCVDPKKVNLLVYWDFNDASNATEAKAVADDLPAGDVIGVLENGAVFTADQGGKSGAAGDRAIDFAPDDGSGTLATGRVAVTDASFLNKIGIIDRASFVFWQKLVTTANSSAFWVDSPSQTRVAQAHTPWSNNNIYFDTAGCCDGGTQRINGDAGALTWTEWHHFAFVKDGPNKRVYVDGSQLLSGVNTGTLSIDIGSLYLGAEPAGGNSLRGWLDEFAVFASALTEAQIDELVAGKKPSELTDAMALPTLTITKGGDGKYTVTTTGTTLQSADGAAGPYTDLGATSVIIDPATVSGSKFYRGKN